MVMSSRVHSVSRMCPAEPLLRCWPAGPAAFVLPLAICATLSGFSGNRLEAGEAKAKDLTAGCARNPSRRNSSAKFGEVPVEDSNAPDAPAEEPADFASVSLSVSYPLGRSMPEQIEVKADGTCIYRMDGRPARGGEKERPPALQTFQLGAGKLHQLEDLLRKTNWLAAPGGGSERGLRDHAEKYMLALVREGQTVRLTCEGQRP